MGVALEKTPGWSNGNVEGKVLGSPECGERGYLEKLLPDGLHLSGESYKVLWDLVRSEIDSLQSDQNKEGATGYAHPEWRDAPW